MGYNAKVYEEQGGDKIVAVSGGEIEVKSGATLDLQSGSTFNVTGTAITATGDEINRAADQSGRLVLVTGTSLSVTVASHDQRTIGLAMSASPNVDQTITLPSTSGSSGARFRFVVSAVSTANYIIKVANATDVIRGTIVSGNSDLSPAIDPKVWVASGTDDTITLDGSTTGGANEGNYIDIEYVASGVWGVSGVTSSTGSIATPFSATVS